MVEEEPTTTEDPETEPTGVDGSVAVVVTTVEANDNPNRSDFSRKRSTKEKVGDEVRKRSRKTVQSDNLISKAAFEIGMDSKRRCGTSSLPNLRNQSLTFVPKDDTSFSRGTVVFNACHTNVNWPKISQHVFGQSHSKK